MSNGGKDMWMASRTGPATVLIAEEHDECRQLFRQFLERCGYEVQTVRSGDHCATLLQKGFRPDVLVVSWELPWADGSGVREWLQSGVGSGTAVVALTARMNPDFRLQESEFPEITWVQRPFRLSELLSAVQSADREAMESPRCLETLWRKTTKPQHGVLFESHASVKNVVDQALSTNSRMAVSPSPARDQFVVCQREDRL
jgi:DNA-binding response OmpR family regulator